MHVQQTLQNLQYNSKHDCNISHVQYCENAGSHRVLENPTSTAAFLTCSKVHNEATRIDSATENLKARNSMSQAIIGP